MCLHPAVTENTGGSQISYAACIGTVHVHVHAVCVCVCVCVCVLQMETEAISTVHVQPQKGCNAYVYI